MRAKHVLTILLVVIAVLFLWHNYRSHGGVAGIKQGTGLSGGGNVAP